MKEDLGFTLEMTALDTDSVTQRAATQPNSFDIADIEYWICKKVWPTGNLQAMDTSKIANYDKIVGIFRSGQADTDKRRSHRAPRRTRSALRPVPNGTDFVQEESGWMTLIPTIYNADTLGIRPDLIGRPISNWSELLNPEFKGKASILDISSIGIMDMAMVVESMGEYTYPDKGNMTKEEIDQTIGIFTEAKKNGQFRAFWKSFDESVNLMASGEVVIQSMWSPAITAVQSQGIPCVYQPLEEGYRSWGGGMGISAASCRARARRSLRIHQLVPVRLGRRLPDASGLLLRCARDLQRVHVRRRMGLLVRRQRPPKATSSAHRRQAGRCRRSPRWRFVPRPHGRCGLLELCHGREPVHGPQVERVHRRLMTIMRVRHRAAHPSPSIRQNTHEKLLRTIRTVTGWLMVSPLAAVLLFFLVLPIVLIVDRQLLAGDRIFDHPGI